ncbi:hypothetical protein GCM10011607_28490 [Shewanella inventionis]|uniref:Uncharacterized protein n=1 Tax=Shewanella inventionis TaxID=1738770 RepID=A0ABQ1JFR7_9GAMM|nr:hypothetical protein [Shewanella inventionis]GGB66115.1 hypothetical protein GCM10011607_28490 [Shewanella inventionis]
MKIVLFDESNQFKSYWLVDARTIVRGENAEKIQADTLLTNLTEVDAILLQTQLTDIRVLAGDYLKSDLNSLYNELTGKPLNLNDLSDVSSLYKVILNTHRMLELHRSQFNGEITNVGPKLSITKYSKNYFSEQPSGAINKTLRFTSVEVAAYLSQMSCYAGHFKKLDVRSTPSLRRFDGEISSYYIDSENYYYAKIQLSERQDRLNVYFQFNRQLQAVLPKDLLLMLIEMADCDVNVLELYEYEKNGKEQKVALPKKMNMTSISGWFSAGIINRVFCHEMSVRGCVSSIFYRDLIRKKTIIRAEKLNSMGIKINSIGPFEINCSVNKDEIDLLNLRAYEVGLYVAK